MALSAQRTQDFVPIKEVRDGIVVLKDGGLRAIVMGSSVNLSLKSYEEQKATIMQFQAFLNTLDFTTQIVVQSRRLDIRPYLMLLEGEMAKQAEPLLKVQTREYMEFIKSFNEEVNIMTKHFFVVVPYSEEALQSGGGSGFSLSGIFGNKNETKKQIQANFEEKRNQLEQRIAVIQQGLGRVGVKSEQLTTEAVIELFYKTFNPGDSQTSAGK